MLQAETSYFRNQTILAMPLAIGQPAPDFLLYSSDKQPVRLSELRGQNVLLLFFPLAFTSTCTAELCSVRDDLTSYDNMNATVFGISVDAPQTLARFKSELGLNFTLLSDFNKEASTDHNAIYEVFSVGLKGVSKRAAFIIDAEGTLRYAEVLENASELPNFDKIRAILTNLN